MKVNSGLCLNVAGASTASGAPVIQYTCQNTYLNDHWYLVTRTNGSWIVNENSRLCLNVAGASLGDNAPVIQYPCQYKYYNDQWTN